ncbi:MAG: DUF2062 domain-containing protein [Bacteroidales bacterium]|nr:DUF2062 domain-containing protein [Bacteroidales bacterium]
MSAEKYYKIFEEKKCCVLIPTYNNAPFLSDVIEDVLKYTSNIIVVNDGSTDNTSDILSKHSGIHIKSYTKNKGKGYALKTGFKYAEELGYEFAITIDSDGQHFASDLPQFLSKLDEHKNAIIIGARNMEGQDQKHGSSFANNFSNFWFRIETAVKHPDTQSGYRLYPLKKINKRRYFSNKYEFEIEVIVRNSWRGLDVLVVPINVFYPEEDKRISHFRPFTDFLRISILNTILVIVAFFYGLPARLVHNIKKKSFRTIIKENILQSKDSNLKISKAVGFGFFMGILPVWGWQTIVALALSHYFKLNKVIVILAANISIPPMLPFILFGSFYTGALVLGNDMDLLHFTTDISFKTVTQDLLQYIVGSVVFAIVAGLVTFAVTFMLLKIFRKSSFR